MPPSVDENYIARPSPRGLKPLSGPPYVNHVVVDHDYFGDGRCRSRSSNESNEGAGRLRELQIKLELERVARREAEAERDVQQKRADKMYGVWEDLDEELSRCQQKLKKEVQLRQAAERKVAHAEATSEKLHTKAEKLEIMCRGAEQAESATREETSRARAAAAEAAGLRRRLAQEEAKNKKLRRRVSGFEDVRIEANQLRELVNLLSAQVQLGATPTETSAGASSTSEPAAGASAGTAAQLAQAQTELSGMRELVSLLSAQLQDRHQVLHQQATKAATEEEKSSSSKTTTASSAAALVGSLKTSFGSWWSSSSGASSKIDPRVARAMEKMDEDVGEDDAERRPENKEGRLATHELTLVADDDDDDSDR